MRTTKLSLNLERKDFPKPTFPQLWIDLGDDYGTVSLSAGMDGIKLICWLTGKTRQVTKKTLRYDN